MLPFIFGHDNDHDVFKYHMGLDFMLNKEKRQKHFDFIEVIVEGISK
jgi:hypothetical protein